MAASVDYAFMESPVGTLLIAGDKAGVRRILFAEGRLEVRPEPGWRENSAALSEAIRQLHAYFGGDFLTYIARLKGADGPDLKHRILGWLERIELSGVQTKRCEELSKGMQQKLQFVAAIIHQPDLLILDEPFSGLDPVNQRLLRDLVLEEHRRGATVLFSTHVMVHAEQLCDHVVMIHKGEKVLDETIAGIRAKFDPRSILFEPMEPEADLRPLEAVPGVMAVKRDGPAWNISLEERADPASVIRAVAAAVAPARIEVRRPTLEDVFVAIVEGSTPAAGEERTRLRALLRENGHAPEVRR
jgi:ABC-2 type transport system ATP-binding protein